MLAMLVFATSTLQIKLTLAYASSTTSIALDVMHNVYASPHSNTNSSTGSDQREIMAKVKGNQLNS